MNTEHSQQNIHPATVDRSNPAAPKRTFAKGIISNSRRIRQRLGVALGLSLGLAALVIVME
ncbi:hypothetical protein [Telluria aromaticivorans]|uniref:Uncharacterized protein n=1 Tax=Telluria aromaticivorans TaxID=2725995 RepID=A0A7Y2K1H8_9BURK|nr:hypothetical protein [Telluria aromaticivorans]NNG23689.1 hypothetical protein [Telluria aromaticivorans]